MQASLLALLSLASGCAATAGYSLLLLLVLSRRYAPTVEYQQPLHFDYSNPVAVATTALGPHDFGVDGGVAAPLTMERALPRGQKV